MKTDKSYGIILILRKDNEEDRFLILKQKPAGHWSFPKGHGEEGESPIESALRELKEETNIDDIELLELPSVSYGYLLNDDKGEFYKTLELFIAFAKDDKVIPQETEVQEYKWTTYQETLDTFSINGLKFSLGVKKVLDLTQKYLEDMLK